MLKINKVTKKFGEFTAVHNLDLEIKKGEIFGIVGANGAGKTTTFRMVLGLLEPTEGNISWCNEKIDHEKSSIIGYLPEERGLYPKLTVKEQLIYFARLRGMEKKDILPEIDYWLEKFQITQYKNKKAGELSKGNQQKVQFIYSVLHKPELLILDEPFSGLDPVNVELLKSAVAEVKDKGTTIIFSSHRMEHVEEMCESIAMFKKGHVIEKGLIKEIKRKYGKKDIIIHTDDTIEIEKIQNLNEVELVEKIPFGYQIKITNENISQKILEYLTKQIYIRKFEIQEPTLNEIFIHRVGDKNE